MAERYALIAADDTWAGGPFSERPTPDAGQRVVVVSLLYPDRAYWSPLDGGGFVTIEAPALISVGRFISLFTLAEQVAIHTAADGSVQLRALLYMLQGFTEGVSLTDPMLVQFVGLLAADGLVTADRATAILAGRAPS